MNEIQNMFDSYTGSQNYEDHCIFMVCEEEKDEDYFGSVPEEEKVADPRFKSTPYDGKVEAFGISFGPAPIKMRCESRYNERSEPDEECLHEVFVKSKRKWARAMKMRQASKFK